MATIYDVAAYIAESVGEVSAMKLQKLMFYSQAWNVNLQVKLNHDLHLKLIHPIGLIRPQPYSIF